MKLNWSRYAPSEEVSVITTIDVNVAGEPLRIVTGGLPSLLGDTILEKRRYMQQHLDHIRRALMWEPRGHRDMYGTVLTENVTPEADLGVLFMHNEGYSTMCGHGTIGLVTALLETGALPARGKHTPVNLDTPAGLVRATAHIDGSGHVENVSFLNVPSFLYARDIEVVVGNYGRLTVDIAFGGAFYVIVPASQVRLRVSPAQTSKLVHAGEAIKKAVNAHIHVKHPVEDDLSFVYGTILTDAPADTAHHSRNVCIFANGEVDRSPTGTGVSARLAQLHAKGEIAEGQHIVIESIVGEISVFGGSVVECTHVGPFEAIVPEVSGTAFISGRHEFIIDPRDQLGRGFLIS